MGCWNKTCMISNLHIRAGQRVAVFILGKRTSSYDDFCYSSSYYDHCPIPFYGEYDDYGGVENCNGIGLNYVVNAIRDQMVELDEGDNQYHDIEAKKDSADINKIFELDHEGRLLIEGNSQAKYPADFLKEARSNLTSEQINSLEGFIKSRGVKALGRTVTHIQIHGDIFDHIINNFTLTDYKTNDKGEYEQFTFGFGDIVADLPEYIGRLRIKCSEASHEPNEKMRNWLFRDTIRDLFDFKEKNLAAKFLRFGEGESSSRFLINPQNIIVDEIQKMNDEEFTNLLIEFLKGAWINTFISYTRRAWIKTTGEGGQNDDHAGHRVLIEAMTKVLDAEKVKYEEDEE